VSAWSWSSFCCLSCWPVGVVRWPGKVPPGKVSNELVHCVDWFTTLTSRTPGCCTRWRRQRAHSCRRSWPSRRPSRGHLTHTYRRGLGERCPEEHIELGIITKYVTMLVRAAEPEPDDGFDIKTDEPRPPGTGACQPARGSGAGTRERVPLALLSPGRTAPRRSAAGLR